MKLDFCAVCGTKESIDHHHFIPRSQGGLDVESNMLTLCREHHGQLHGVEWKNNLSYLVKEGLKRAKENGKILGGWKATRKDGSTRIQPFESTEVQKRARKTRKEKADNNARDFMKIINEIQNSNIMTHGKIAKELNERGVTTVRGNKWTSYQITRIMKRLEVI